MLRKTTGWKPVLLAIAGRMPAFPKRPAGRRPRHAGRVRSPETKRTLPPVRNASPRAPRARAVAARAAPRARTVAPRTVAAGTVAPRAATPRATTRAAPRASPRERAAAPPARSRSIRRPPETIQGGL